MAHADIEVRFAWWLRPYLSTLIFFCVLMDSLPDEAKLRRVLGRAVRIRIGGGKWQSLAAPHA